MTLKLAHLKPLRVVISLLFFMAVSILFLDYRHFLPASIFNKITYLQFVPSTLKFISILSISAIGFILIIILTVLFGRIYCSTICPLGVFQDIISRISKRFKKKKKKHYYFSTPYNFIRYGILIITVITFLISIKTLVNWLDPYSVFGRLLTFFFKPLVIWLNNLASIIFEKFEIYSFYHIKQTAINLIVYIIPVFFFVIIIVFSALRGRFYCNTICPVGTLLGFFSKISLFKIKFKSENCINCGLCEKTCKSQCIDYKNQTIDVSRCVDCFNCLAVCKSEAFEYSFKKNKKTEALNKKEYYSANRRKLITGGILFTTGLLGIHSKNLKAATNEELVEIDREFPVSPPGSKSIGHFKSICTACSLCINACPTNVLQPSLFEYGLLGIMQPYMDFSTSFCNYECTKCGEVCPTGAILPLTVKEKKTTQTGIAKFVKNNCIVITNETECVACSEHCPTKATTMISYKNDLVIPEIDESICIGCGACEFACPAKPYKAIYVEGNEVHKKAELPNIEKLDENNTMEEFPF